MLVDGLRFAGVVLASCVAVSGAARANDTAPAKIFAVGPTVGSLGVGLEMSYLVYYGIALRANATYLNFNFESSIGDLGFSSKYDFDVRGYTGAALVDWHFANTGWRFTTGFRYVNAEFKDVDATGKTFGTKVYKANEVGLVRTSVKNSNPLAPYLGFGYDTTHFSRDGTSFALGIDVGALYAGDAEVKITTEKTLPGLDADIAQEVSKLRSELDRYYRFYPVIMLSGKLAF